MRKKILVSFVMLVLFAVNAGAQAMKMHFGGNFAIQYYKDNNVFDSSLKTPDNTYTAFQIVLKPRLYWYINEKMQFGAYFGVGYGNLVSGIANNDNGQQPATFDTESGMSSQSPSSMKDIGKSLGWCFTPFFSYRALELGRLSLWVEGSIYYGMYNKVSKGNSEPVLQAWNRKENFGILAMPVIQIDITEKLGIQFHAGVLSLGWEGEYLHYNDRNEYVSFIDAHKGDLLGFLRSLGDFGVGVVQRF